MKFKGFFLKGAFVFSFISLAQLACAQFSIGPKFGYNSFQETVGVGAQVAIIASEKFRVSADIMKHAAYTDYNSQTEDPLKISTTTYRAFHELNFNFSYLFKADKAYFYPIIGMNIAYYYKNIDIDNYVKYSPTSDYYDDYIGGTTTSEEKSKSGLNLGAGAQFNLGLISPFLECKYSISKIESGSIAAGVLFNFGRGKKQE